MVIRLLLLSLNSLTEARMIKKLFLAFLVLLSTSSFASAGFCPLVSDIHRVELVDAAYYVSGLQFPLNKNRYVVRIASILYTPDGHKWSLWTEPYSAEDEESAKTAIINQLSTLKGPVAPPKEHYWGDEQCWYLLGNGLYVVARFWW